MEETQEGSGSVPEVERSSEKELIGVKSRDDKRLNENPSNLCGGKRTSPSDAEKNSTCASEIRKDIRGLSHQEKYSNFKITLYKHGMQESISAKY